MKWICQLGCYEQVEIDSAHDLLHHLRQFHPDQFGSDIDFERWPDGEVVVADMTLDPQDFTEADR